MKIEECLNSKDKKCRIFMPIKELDAEIRTIEKPDKDEKIWRVEVGLFESTGEKASDIDTLHFDNFPTEKEIREGIRDDLKDYLKELDRGMLSGREEMQFKALKKINLKGG